MIKITDPIFPIVGYSDIKKPFVVNGTAFFVNGKGAFVSAGHNFKNGTLKYFAVIGGREIPIDVPNFREHEPFDSQVPPIYKDLALGRVDGIDSGCFLQFCGAENIALGSEIEIPGFLLRKEFAQGDIGSIEDLDFDEEPITMQEFDRSYKLGRIMPYQIKGRLTGAGFRNIGVLLDLPGFFDNGFTIEVPGDDFHGVSGAPVLVDGKVIGIFIAATAIIGRDYILAALRAAKVEI